MTAPARRGATERADDQLVAAVRAGDDRAFELLYDRYHRRISAYINGMVGDHGRSEEIAQDVFLSALRRMRETDRPLAFKPWVYEIAKNACIDQFRRSRRADEISYDVDEGMGAAESSRFAPSRLEPDDAVHQKQQLDDLRGAFGGLSETHHEILVMRELEGLSYREIGERLGLSRPSVESTLFRARRRLTAEYDEIITGERCRRTQRLIVTLAGGGSVGARDTRQLARHVAYCQPCRRQARRSGVDRSVVVEVKRRAGMAALFPLPFLRRRGGAPAEGGGHLAGSHGSAIAQWSAGMGTSLDPIIAGASKVAAAAATIALAGAGVGAVSTQNGVPLRGPLSGITGEKAIKRQQPAAPKVRAGLGLRERPIARAPVGAAAAKPPPKKAAEEASPLDPVSDAADGLPEVPESPQIPEDPSDWPDNPPSGMIPKAGQVNGGGGSPPTTDALAAAVTGVVDAVTGRSDDEGGEDGGGGDADIFGD